MMTPLAERILSLARLSVFLTLAFCSAGPFSAQAFGQSREYEIKAAYLYNFGKYVDWPQDNAATFVIGVVGNDPFGGELDELSRTKQLGGRTITIRRMKKPEDYSHCHMLFVAQGTSDELAKAVLGQARQHSCLIVGEEPNFAQAEGMVNFIVQNNRVLFEINPGMARKSGLRISSRLLRLGRIVD